MEYLATNSIQKVFHLIPFFAIKSKFVIYNPFINLTIYTI